MRIDVESVSDRLGLILGATIFLFGFLKFFDPFHTWFRVQIESSGLPEPCFVLGITGEIGTGLAFLCCFFARRRLAESRHVISAAACLSLIIIMCVATYVHLQPRVPAAALPLQIKSPVIPLSLLTVAIGDLVMQSDLWLGQTRSISSRTLARSRTSGSSPERLPPGSS